MSVTAPPRYRDAAVVIPAHNEVANLPACLRAVVTAALCAPVHVTVVVVLDASDDGSSQLAGRYGPDVHFVSINACNVGAARAAGFRYVRSLCGADASCWYATTDADSRVDPDWLVRQLRCAADMILGLVRVADWHPHPPEVIDRYLGTYGAGSATAHNHVHGANMGFSAPAYWAVGGFPRLSTGEDIELVARFEASGFLIHRDSARSVVTSARIHARAPRGFAHHLQTLADSNTGDCA